ncbi:MAG: aminotransferase DegT [Chloroflexi bacterium RBG_16_48_7]|nr:MAG: aminotransferase DegT [Chloroflexi bacterium RBG_16_48_7]
MFIPVNSPLLDGNEKQYLAECIASGWISSEGPYVRRLEAEFAASVHRQNGIAVSSGSGALDIAVAALRIGPGDEVIMPSFTIISCAQAVVRAGATPVLVDSDPKSWNMDSSRVTGRITERTKAVMAVHIYGLTVDMENILDVADRHALHVIEDAAQAIGQTCNGRPCGSFGNLSIFSFYPNKLITTGEGGMVVTDDDELAERCRSLRDLCFQKEKRFFHEELGWNYRMTNLQAAVGCAQLERLAAHVSRKREIGERYTELLGGLPVQLPLASTRSSDNIYWVYGLVLQDEVTMDTDEVMARLADRNIGTRPFFWPMHEQPVFQKLGLFKGESFPVAEQLARRGFYLPSGLALKDREIEYVAGALRQILS